MGLFRLVFQVKMAQTQAGIKTDPTNLLRIFTACFGFRVLKHFRTTFSSLPQYWQSLVVKNTNLVSDQEKEGIWWEKKRKNRTRLRAEIHVVLRIPQSRAQGLAQGELVVKAKWWIHVPAEFSTQGRRETDILHQIQPQNQLRPLSAWTMWGREAPGHLPLAKGQVLRTMLASCLPGQGICK